MAKFVTNEIMGTALEVTERYSRLEPQGIGASGVICSAHDSIGNKTVAIKKIANPFENPAVTKRAYREVHLLSNLRHDNLINMRDIFISPSEDLYIVTDCIRTDLHRLLQSTSKPLEARFVQFFTYQMLRGLKYIHSAGIIHRDLKPSNLLSNDNCDMKICDFGLAREQDAHHMTGYVVTRYYRAPEIMLTWQKYTYAVDIWSVGCIVAEMLLRRVLFAGKDHVHQFTLITDLLGKPPKEVMERVYSKNTLEFVESLPEREPIPLTSLFRDADPQAINLVEKMLNLDPERRITTTDALKHPYVSTYHDPEDEPVFEKHIDWSLLDSELSADEWKSNMYFEILDYHRGACDREDKDIPITRGNLDNWPADQMMVDTY
ncbi:uncharacterized protein N7443_010801 [Penicillium atrosanguineum]|uniref:uncharacterized protein n=1 Tax=Penicillium atrosanguineum TaxID=1132637 RepID=UPI00239FB5CC|nr:uncharacterized protein N7443_010801 [Penicillium atrosanguineum]KAJ5290548.1 hypothetical protein N7443_010801 [Penicillium atrosanguineum]